jgi:hypothetical protein
MTPYKNYYLIIVFVFPVVIAGCASVIGFGIGYTIDQSAKSRTRIASALPLEPGAAIIAVLKDSTQYSGQYEGYCGPGSFEAGDTAYLANNILPYYGEQIEAIDTMGVISRYIFNGFFFHREGQAWIPLMTVSRADNSTRNVDLRSLRDLRSGDGTEIIQSDMRKAFAEMKVPPLSCLVISDSSLMSPIPLREIDHLEAPVKKDAAKRGLLIGLIIDTVFWTTTYIVALTNWPAD